MTYRFFIVSLDTESSQLMQILQLIICRGDVIFLIKAMHRSLHLTKRLSYPDEDYNLQASFDTDFFPTRNTLFTKSLTTFFKLLLSAVCDKFIKCLRQLFFKERSWALFSNQLRNPNFRSGNCIFMSRDTIHINLKNILRLYINNLHLKRLNTDNF